MHNRTMQEKLLYCKQAQAAYRLKTIFIQDMGRIAETVVAAAHDMASLA